LGGVDMTRKSASWGSLHNISYIAHAWGAMRAARQNRLAANAMDKWEQGQNE